MSTKQHNPANLRPDQIPPGHRLLDEDEILKLYHNLPAMHEVLCWTGNEWEAYYAGNWRRNTYCTTLTRAELRAARNLPTEQASNQNEGGDAVCPVSRNAASVEASIASQSLAPVSNAAPVVQSHGAATEPAGYAVELLPCPFCGGNNVKLGGHDGHRVYCLDCDAGIDNSNGIPGSRIWDRRPIEEALRAKVEELTRELEQTRCEYEQLCDSMRGDMQKQREAMYRAVEEVEATARQQLEETTQEVAILRSELPTLRAEVTRLRQQLEEARAWKHTFEVLGGTPELAWEFHQGLEANKLAWERKAEEALAELATTRANLGHADAKIAELQDFIREMRPASAETMAQLRAELEAAKQQVAQLTAERDQYAALAEKRKEALEEAIAQMRRTAEYKDEPSPLGPTGQKITDAPRSILYGAITEAEAALALTSSTALREHDLRVAEEAWKECYRSFDANPGNEDYHWNRSATRARIESGEG